MKIFGDPNGQIKLKQKIKVSFCSKLLALNLTYSNNIFCMNKIKLYKYYSQAVFNSTVYKFLKGIDKYLL